MVHHSKIGLPMAEMGLGRVKTSALAARVEYLERIAYD
jgi:hypothetical protein